MKKIVENIILNWTYLEFGYVFLFCNTIYWLDCPVGQHIHINNDHMGLNQLCVHTV